MPKGKKKKSKAPLTFERTCDRVDKNAVFSGNFVPTSCKGCYIAHFNADWLLGTEPFNPAEFGLKPREKVPDISIDPDSRMLTVINQKTCVRCFYITLGNEVEGEEALFEMGSSRDEEGNIHRCATFIIVVQPRCIVDVCYVNLPPGGSLDLHSDISDLNLPALSPADDEFDPSRVFPFPLGGDGPYLCSQAMGGQFTHFYPTTRHAVDFECPVGTPVLALGDGIVVDVQDSNCVSGIHTRNLYLWNSIMIRLDTGIFVEYVHIQKSSAAVKVGDRVSKSQIICLSGDVGFCPCPHLHFQLHLSDAKDAVTIKFALAAADGTPYFPVAGLEYGRDGPVAMAESLALKIAQTHLGAPEPVERAAAASTDS